MERLWIPLEQYKLILMDDGAPLESTCPPESVRITLTPPFASRRFQLNWPSENQVDRFNRPFCGAR
eukprot:9480097-Pyramimonas_sp.AAC.1